MQLISQFNQSIYQATKDQRPLTSRKIQYTIIIVQDNVYKGGCEAAMRPVANFLWRLVLACLLGVRVRTDQTDRQSFILFVYSPFLIWGIPVYGYVFTARCYASAVLAMGLCPSVCVLSVTSRSSTKMAKRRITQTTPHDSPGTLVF